MKKFIAFITSSMCLYGVHATNISVSAVALTGQNTAAGVNNAANYYEVNFNLNWSNSWNVENDPSNRDAAWVFAKARVGASDITLNNASSSSNTITVSSTANLRKGMPVKVLSGTGSLNSSTVILNIINATQFTVTPFQSPGLVNATILCSRFWEPVYFKNTGYTESSNSTITPGLLYPTSPYDSISNPVMGVYVSNSNIGTAFNNTFNNLKLRWNYVPISNIKDNDYIEIRVFAIEMVYVPGNVTFNVGGGGGTSAFTSSYISTGNTTSALSMPSGVSSLGISDFPNGYNAFYCMKYEISQGQYRDFLNSLNLTQQTTRTPSTDIANRFGIKFSTVTNGPNVYYCDLDNDNIPNEANDGEWIACNYLSYYDGCAFADWAGLRPMTELEYEKACRGPLPPVSGEYASGSSAFSPITGLTNPGTISEASISGTLVHNNAGGVGPKRVGLLASASSTTRILSGATYYGILDMSGNLYEHVLDITSGTAVNSFRPYNGDGLLTPLGNSNVTFWPGASNDTQSATHQIIRGGSWSSTSTRCQVSDRFAVSTNITGRVSDVGFRAVRSE